MAYSPARSIKFRIIFAICWWAWTQVHVIILHRFGFSWKVSLIDGIVSNLLLAGITMLITVTLRFYIPQKNKYGYILALCGVLTVIWFLVSRSIVMLLIKNVLEYDVFFSRSLPIRIAIGFLITGCMALISVLLYTVQDQQEMEKRKTETEQLSKEAELYKLRQQLQPHFLFNSLNSINALIGTEPQQARMMIQQLSDFLRGTLKKEDQWTTLEEELQHLQLYLEIEKLRFGHRLSTTIKNEIVGETFQLPAMLLQPVVENAIKFGLYDTIGEITISIEAKNLNGDLLIEVKNPFDPETSSPKKGTGFGLNSVQRRLYLLFARNDLLQTATREEIFITTIKIPQQNDKGDHH